jgi:hypothetical protein
MRAFLRSAAASVARVARPLLFVTALLGPFWPAPARAQPWDLVIYGGSSAAVTCAVQAAEDGLRAVIVAPEGRIGGLTTSGLGATDTGDVRAIGGLAREFYAAVHAHYLRPEAWTRERREASAGWRPRGGAQWRFEPHVAEGIFARWLRDARTHVLFGVPLRHVERRGSRLRALVLADGRRLEAHHFVDATYEGDLLAAAGVSWTLGREANALYGETLNGVQRARAIHHAFDRPVSGYRDSRRPWLGLLPGIEALPCEPDGAGDHRVQAYNYRICLTDVPHNRRAFERPPGYDERAYELLLRLYDAGWKGLPWHSVALPNRKTDTNNNGPVSTDRIGASRPWVLAGPRERLAIAREHERWQRGLLWTLAHHPRVPEAVRREAGTWGLARDEFVENGGWPPQLYVREGRRLVGEVVVTQHHCDGKRVAADVVGMASYNMDSHHVRRWLDEKGHVHNEGDVQVAPRAPYGIPFGALVPRREEAENLLVPVCLSASHIAYGSVRMEPVFMILGQSAAIAARIARQRRCALQDLPYRELRPQLLAAGQVLELPPPPRPRGGLDPDEIPGVVRDDEQAACTGPWVRSTSTPPFVGRGYRHDGATGRSEALFELRPPRPGRWAVEIAWSPHANRTPAALVTLEQGPWLRRAHSLDQRLAPAGPGPWQRLGLYELGKGPLRITVRNGRPGAYLIVDAVRLVER